jgi:hypothetical protein
MSRREKSTPRIGALSDSNHCFLSMRLTPWHRKAAAMSTERRSVRITGTALAVGMLLGAAAAPSAATPEHPTPEESNFVNAIRGKFPGDDAQLIQAGEQACTMLAYRMAPASEVNSLLATRYGASPDQAANLVSAAHGIICPYVPG